MQSDDRQNPRTADYPSMPNPGAGPLDCALPGYPGAQDELALLRRFYELYREHPFGGSRMTSKTLKPAENSVGHRRTNENTNRLLPQYLTKSTDLSDYTLWELNTIA